MRSSLWSMLTCDLFVCNLSLGDCMFCSDMFSTNQMKVGFNLGQKNTGNWVSIPNLISISLKALKQTLIQTRDSSLTVGLKDRDHHILLSYISIKYKRPQLLYLHNFTCFMSKRKLFYVKTLFA